MAKRGLGNYELLKHGQTKPEQTCTIQEYTIAAFYTAKQESVAAGRALAEAIWAGSTVQDSTCRDSNGRETHRQTQFDEKSL